MSGNYMVYYKVRGRGESLRYALYIAGIQYEDKLFDDEDWPRIKKDKTESGELIFSQVPLLHIDGRDIVQSTSILRYIARNYLQKDFSEDENLNCDMMLEAWNDLQNGFFDATYYRTKDEEKFFSQILPNMLELIEKFHLRLGTDFLASSKPSIADCLAISMLQQMLEFRNDLLARMFELPAVKEYKASGREHEE